MNITKTVVGVDTAKRTALHTNLSRLISANSGSEVHHPL